MFSVMPFGFLFIFVFMMGSVVSLSSLHWLGIWLGLEVNLMGFIPILVYRGITQETESGVKYFIVQALGSGLIMAGSLSCYNLLLSWEVPLGGGFSLGLLVLLSGLMVKLGSFPFHFWLPSVMAGISWFGCLILTTWQKVAPIFLLGVLVEGLRVEVSLDVWIVVIAGLSSLVGGVGGMNQTQVRALLAYSSIGHVGWMVMASVISRNVLMVYFLVYFVISICLFLVLWWFEESNYGQTSAYSGKWGKVVQVSTMFMLLSLGGMPPLLGFVGKWLVIYSCSSTEYPFSIVFLLLGSLISLFYYLSLMFSILLFSGSSLSSMKGNVEFMDLMKKDGPSINSSLDEGFLSPVKESIFLGRLNFFGFNKSGVSLVYTIFVLNLLGGIFIFYSLPLMEFI
uniref:NADH-ubiquinone oxidoreductase chain 2 n=1 Tax=Tectus virgatus TaxID=1980019 RepID=A0A1W5YRS6_9VEST|nr:NADH dehydrogenase subunit 2 [Tectus virgatus]